MQHRINRMEINTLKYLFYPHNRTSIKKYKRKVSFSSKICSILQNLIRIFSPLLIHNVLKDSFHFYLYVQTLKKQYFRRRTTRLCKHWRQPSQHSSDTAWHIEQIQTALYRLQRHPQSQLQHKSDRPVLDISREGETFSSPEIFYSRESVRLRKRNGSIYQINNYFFLFFSFYTFFIFLATKSKY